MKQTRTIDPIGGLYVCPQIDRIPNASAVHSVIKDENGEWQYKDTVLCLFREPILILDRWSRKLSKRQTGRYYICLYKDTTIAIPIKWIDEKDIYERVENGQL
jgi:hypothetical protein